jgi:hypothetical protein
LRKIHTLEQKIAASRHKLQALWDAHGCTDSEALAAGSELDDLMNEYEWIKTGLRYK